jgi:hypothetical protein
MPLLGQFDRVFSTCRQGDPADGAREQYFVCLPQRRRDAGERVRLYR